MLPPKGQRPQPKTPFSTELPEQEGAGWGLDVAQDALYLSLHVAGHLAFPSPSWGPPWDDILNPVV